MNLLADLHEAALLPEPDELVFRETLVDGSLLHVPRDGAQVLRDLHHCHDHPQQYGSRECYSTYTSALPHDRCSISVSLFSLRLCKGYSVYRPIIPSLHYFHDYKYSFHSVIDYGIVIDGSYIGFCSFCVCMIVGYNFFWPVALIT